MLGDKLGLHTVPLTTEWVKLASPMCCNAIEVEADVNWEWRTNPGASKGIPAGVNYLLVGNEFRPEAYQVPLCRFILDDEICEVRAAKAGKTGTLWIKCVR